MRTYTAQKQFVWRRFRWATYGALIILALTAVAASAAVFQYSMPAVTSKEAAFLWIPSGAGQVRGVVMCGMTLVEREYAKDERVRQACANQQLAIVFLKCGLSQAELQKVLDDLALFVDEWCCEKFLMAEDLNRDRFVEFTNFSIFANNCLRQE